MSLIQDAIKRMEQDRKIKAANPKDTPDKTAQPPRREPVARKIDGECLEVKVDRDRLREAGFLAPVAYERRLAEEYRRVKRPLLANAFSDETTTPNRANLIMIASALSGEGKTHTCINLALSMAMEKERTVLLVDADVAKPEVSRMFGVENEPGLLDLLADDHLDPADVLVKTDVPKLSILPAGRHIDNATELLASDRMREICEELADRYPNRVILFDSPPILATSEAGVLASQMGQIGVVIAEGLTSRESVREAVAALPRESAINVILNKSRTVSAGGDYYGYYGQREGERATQQETQAHESQ